MTPVSSVSTLSRRVPMSVRMAALALLAGLTYGAAMTGPASAASNDWRAGCDYKAAPQGYGDSIRYNNCMHQSDCQRMANAAGTTMYSAGCFGAAPDAPAAPITQRPSR